VAGNSIVSGSGQSKYLISDYEGNEYTRISKLTIKNLGEEDSGAYKCLCYNEMTDGKADVVAGHIFVQLESGKCSQLSD